MSEKSVASAKILVKKSNHAEVPDKITDRASSRTHTEVSENQFPDAPSKAFIPLSSATLNNPASEMSCESHPNYTHKTFPDTSAENISAEPCEEIQIRLPYKLFPETSVNSFPGMYNGPSSSDMYGKAFPGVYTEPGHGVSQKSFPGGSSEAYMPYSPHNETLTESPFAKMPEGRKRRSITVKEKLAFLELVEKGERVSHAAAQFGIAKSTACTIWKEKDKIKQLHDHYKYDPKRKRIRLGNYPDVSEAVGIWYQEAKSRNEQVNGPLLQQKARVFAHLLGYKEFKASSGWLCRLRERYDMSLKNMKAVNEDSVVLDAGRTDEEIAMIVKQNNPPVSDASLPNLYPDCIISEGVDNININYTNESVKVNKQENGDVITDERVTSNDNNLDDSSCSKFPESDNSFPRIASYYPYNSFCNNSLNTRQAVEDSYYKIPTSLALTLAGKLTEYLHQQENTSKEVIDSMSVVHKHVYGLLQEKQQKKITDYFRWSNR